jgi:hypothetical protein
MHGIERPAREMLPKEFYRRMPRSVLYAAPKARTELQTMQTVIKTIPKYAGYHADERYD